MLIDYFRFAFRSIRYRKLRNGLTILGILIGIAAIVALIATGQGMQQSLVQQFEKVGANRIIVSPGAGTYGPLSTGITAAKLTEDDIKVIIETSDSELTTWSDLPNYCPEKLENYWELRCKATPQEREEHIKKAIDYYNN